MSDEKKQTMKVDGLGTPGIREVKVDYPGNSYIEKENSDSKKVIHGEVIRKKKTLGQKIRGTFFSGDLNDVVPNLVSDILIPRMQDIFLDLINDGLEMLIHGEVRNRRRSNSFSSLQGRVNYSERYRIAQSNAQPRQSIRSSRVDFDQIILEDQYDAKTVLRNMRDAIAQYGQVSIADLCDYLDITSNYTDNKYGWFNLNDARIRRVSSGYLIDLPDPVPLD